MTMYADSDVMREQVPGHLVHGYLAALERIRTSDVIIDPRACRGRRKPHLD